MTTPNREQMLQIQIQWPDKSYGEARDFAEHFGCTCEKTKHKGYFIIKADDPEKFYWLGANIHNGHFNQCQPSSLSKFIEL